MMSKRINKSGRNELCSCGSGKKHKKCCLLKSSAKGNMSSCVLTVTQAQETLNKLMMKKILPFFNRIVEKTDNKAPHALTDFLLNDVTNLSPIKEYKEALEDNLFAPWAFFSWIPDENFSEILGFDENKTIAQNYLRSHEKQLTLEEKYVIQSMNEVFHSFYQVENVVPGKVIVRDLLLEETYTVTCETDYNTEENFISGEIVFASILTVSEQCCFVGLTPMGFPPEWQEEILDLKMALVATNEGVPLTADLLRDDFEEDVRESYFDIVQDFLDIQEILPRNADGEVELEAKLFFELDLPIESAFERLAPLMRSRDPMGFLKDAERNRFGNITKIKFLWLAEMNHGDGGDAEEVELGHVTLEPGMLLLETDSEGRIEKGRLLIDELLGEAVEFQKIGTMLKEFVFEGFSDLRKFWDEKREAGEAFL